MTDGENIENYLKEFIFSHKDIEIKITRRALKHIVEQRKKDAYSKDTILSIFIVLEKSMNIENYQIIKDRKIYIFTEKVYTDKKGILVILEITSLNPKIYHIRTAFYRLVSKIQKYIQKMK